MYNQFIEMVALQLYKTSLGMHQQIIAIIIYHLFPCAAPTVAVSVITVAWVNDTAVRVAWTALTLNDERGFPSYVVSVMSRCEQVPSQTTNSTSVVVGGLMPHTEYNITVQALTAGGTKEGPISAPGEMDTEQMRHIHVHVRILYDTIYAHFVYYISYYLHEE